MWKWNVNCQRQRAHAGTFAHQTSAWFRKRQKQKWNFGSRRKNEYNSNKPFYGVRCIERNVISIFPHCDFFCVARFADFVSNTHQTRVFGVNIAFVFCVSRTTRIFYIRICRTPRPVLRTPNDSRAPPYWVYALGLCPCVWYQYALAQMTRCEFTYQLSVAQHSIRKTFKVKLESYSVWCVYFSLIRLTVCDVEFRNARRKEKTKKKQNYFINTGSLQRNWSQHCRAPIVTSSSTSAKVKKRRNTR